MKISRLFDEFPFLDSPTLTLKKIEDNDLNEVFSIYNNNRVFEYCGIIPKHNIDTVKNMIGHFQRDFIKKSRIKWGIFIKSESNIMVGIIEAMGFDHKVNKLIIGYFLNEKYWGRGIATEAVRILLSFLFDKIDVNKVEAEVMPANNASKKVLMKNGFLKEGLNRQGALWPGKGIVDLEMYGILKADYKSRARLQISAQK